jgi:hypothetical protein
MSSAKYIGTTMPTGFGIFVDDTLSVCVVSK